MSRGMIDVSTDLLEAALHLPKGVKIHNASFRADDTGMGLGILRLFVQGDNLPESTAPLRAEMIVEHDNLVPNIEVRILK